MMKFLLAIFLYSILFTFSMQFRVQIGAIFFYGEDDLVKAFDTAIKDIEKQKESQFKFVVTQRFLRTDDSIRLQRLACDLIGNGIAAIFGPSSKASSDIVAGLCNLTGIPHLQFDWHGQDIQQHRHNHQMSVNVAPIESIVSLAYAEILQSYDWKSYTILYDSSSALARMEHLLASKQVHKTGIKILKFERSKSYQVLWKQISNTREKLVLLDCSPEIVTEVVNASVDFNMTGQFNKLFFTNLDTHVSGIEKLYSTEFRATTSAVRLRSFVPSPVHDEIDVFGDDEDDKIISMRSQLLYDSVILFFNAMRTLLQTQVKYKSPVVGCDKKGYWEFGPKLVEIMKNLTYKDVSPHYKTQKLQLNKFGEREEFNLEVYNPMINRVTHVWNRNHQLVPVDKILDNTTIKANPQNVEEIEDFSQKRHRYKVATRLGEPYFMWRPEPEGVHYEGNERFEGYAVDLIYKLAEECKFDFDFEPVPDNNYGNYNPVTDEWNGIIRQLIDNHAQIGICDLTITQARRTVVDFTVPFMQLGVSILHYKTPPPPPNVFSFLTPYAVDIWIYLLTLLLVASMAMVVLARASQPEWEPVNEGGGAAGDCEVEEVENKWHLVNTLWLMIGSLLAAGCDILPRGGPARLLTSFWWIFSLLISQTYIAKLASHITASKMSGSINDLHDLVDQNKIQFGTVKGGSTSLLFSESNETDYRLAWNKMIAMKPEAFTVSNKEGVDRVKRSRGRYAFLMETTNLQYYIQRSCELTQIGQPFGQKHYGIAVPLNANFRTNLSVGILKLSEKGILYSLKNKWFNSNITDCATRADGVSENEAFTMESVGGLFYVLIVGMFVATLIAVCEFFWHVQNIAVNDGIPIRVVLKAEFKFFLRFWIKRKPLHTYLESRDSTSTGYSSYEGSTTSATIAKKRKKTKKKRQS